MQGLDTKMDKLFYASSETCADLWYLSGFCAPDAFLFFQTDKGAVAAVSCLELGRARKECRPSVKVADVQHLEEVFGIEAEPAGGNWFLRMVHTVCRGTGVWEWNVPASFPLEYADLLRGAGIQVTPCWNLTPERRIKSREEIEKVRRGERLAEAGLASYALIRFDSKDKEYISASLKGLVRNNDIVGADDDGSLFLVLTQTNRKAISIVGERLDKKGLKYEIIVGN